MTLDFRPFDLFPGPEHEPFFWPAENRAAAVVLVHGFPGTPAEMKPLARQLHQQGWTVHGVLLPGFGAQFPQLGFYHQQDWQMAVTEAVQVLQTRYQRVLLVGYSMGAALSLAAAVETKPDGLILLAPFQRLFPAWYWRLAWHLLKPGLRRWRPFRKADFDEPRLQAGLGEFFGSERLADPALQNLLRQLPIPVELVDHIRRTGQTAYRLAPQLSTPTLIIQGHSDSVVQPALTRRLLGQLTTALHYCELEADHNFILADNPAFEAVSREVLRFAQQLPPQSPASATPNPAPNRVEPAGPPAERI